MSHGVLSAPWYPLMTVAIVIVFRFTVVNVSPFAMFRSLLLAVAAGALFEILASAVLRSRHRGGVATFGLILLLLIWGNAAGVVLVALYVVLATLLGVLPQHRIEPGTITATSNFCAGVLAIMVLTNAVSAGRITQAVQDLGLRQGSDAGDPAVSALLPDFYVVMMDGYARPDALKAVFEYDDTPFLTFLTEHGFETSSQSRSNYPSTALTLVSMLNMAYLENIPAIAAELAAGTPDPQAYGVLREAINDNRVFAELRGHGYQVVSVGSGFEQVALRSSDLYIDSGGLNSFEIGLLNSAPGLAQLVQSIAPDFTGDQARARFDASMGALIALGRDDARRPRLILVHLMVPHPPAIFGPNGGALPSDVSEPYTDTTADYAGAKQRYVGQLQYLNGRIEAALGSLLLPEGRPRVIVLMSDHGSRYGSDQHPYVRDAESVDNFFSVHAPGRSHLFTDSTTPVNLFPTLFNAYLGTDLAMQPDRSFLSGTSNAFQLTEVTP